MWRGGTSTGFDSNETNQAGAGDVITLRSRDKLKTYLDSRLPMATKLGRMITYLDGLLPIKSCGPLITWSCEIT